jgi:hypothetical protein
MVSEYFSEVAKFVSQNANEKNKFKIVSIKCEGPSVFSGYGNEKNLTIFFIRFNLK